MGYKRVALINKQWEMDSSGSPKKGYFYPKKFL